jgi:hypothetical protein
MQFSYLVTFTHPDPDARISARDLETMTTRVDTTPNLRRARLYTPQHAGDDYTNDGPSPIFALHLDFDTLAALEASIAADDHLQSIARRDFPSLAACAVEQQVMARCPASSWSSIRAVRKISTNGSPIPSRIIRKS